ncbi:hypothetical protein [Mucilaginibacter sp.]|uniref:hypothetical protein n=1 Tax=Mucilaginibacter sp. TaxID=1882438 RepID=UPI0035BC1B7F
MKPTAQQIKTLQDYLHQTLVYREAYEEIYDHILTALEHQPDNIPFQEAINNIIRVDFGDPKNLLKVEKSIKTALVNDAIRKYLGYVKSYFAPPGLWFTVVGALAAYYFFVNAKVSPGVVMLIFGFIAICPSVIWLLRLYNTGYILDTTRKSAKDKLFETFTGIPVRVLLVPLLFTSITNYTLWQVNNNYLITLFFVIGVIYNLSLYKLYKEEFKTASAK